MTWVIGIAIIAMMVSAGVASGQNIITKEMVFFSGTVKEMAWDQQFIIVQGKKCFISNETQIVDQRDNRIKWTEIKHNSEVAIDAIRHPNGYRAIKIVLITDRGV